MGRDISRRRFLGTSVAAGIAAAGAGHALAKEVAAAPSIPWRGAEKEQVNIAIIGTGWRGMDHVREFKPISRANVFAVCDTDTRFLADATKALPHAQAYGD